MKTLFQQDDLAALGFPDAQLGAPEPVPVPTADSTARGFSSADAAADPWTAILRPPDADEVLLPAGVEAAEAAGFEVSWGETTERLYFTCEAPFRVLPDGAAGVARVADRVILTLSQLTGPCLLLGAEDIGVAIATEAGRPYLCAFEGRPLALPPTYIATPPVADWLEPFIEDTWLVDLVRARLESPRPWDHAVAAGVLDRLHRSTPKDARRRVAALLATGRAEPTSPARVWFEALDAVQLHALDRETAEEAQILTEALDDTLSRLDPDASVWCETMSALLADRDDLEGVWTLLDAANADARTRAVLDALDDRMRDDVRAWPPFEISNEQRLIRAASATPDAWWVAPWHLWRDER